MSKKSKKVIVISAMEIWEMRKPRHNGYICGHGAHGDKKYNRRKIKQNFDRYGW